MVGPSPPQPPVAEADDPCSTSPPPVTSRELLSVLGLVILADLTIYRGHGFAGMATLIAGGHILLLVGAPRRRMQLDSAIVGTMALLLVGALVWCGTVWQVAIGAALVISFAMTLIGLRPYLVDLVLFTCVTIVTGVAGLSKYLRSLDRVTAVIPRATWLKVIFPAAAVLGFGTLFVCANPDEAKTIGQWLQSDWRTVWEQLLAFSPTAPEFLLWIGAAWIAGGLLRPLLTVSVFADTPRAAAEEVESAAAPLFESSLYPAVRNTLIAVIVLFAAYLGFEFRTLWFRVFPKGFYYAGYAHEGAAWLTAALALATAVLSAIFRAAFCRTRGCRDCGSWPGSGQRRTCSWRWRFTTACTSTLISTG